jgi:hypothetical protein
MVPGLSFQMLGLLATGGLGTLSPSLLLALVGSAGTGQTGGVSVATNARTAALTGQSATAFAGSMRVIGPLVSRVGVDGRTGSVTIGKPTRSRHG